MDERTAAGMYRFPHRRPSWPAGPRSLRHYGDDFYADPDLVPDEVDPAERDEP